MDIVGRIDGGGRGSFRLGDGRLVDLFGRSRPPPRLQPQRPIADADDADMGVARFFVAILIVEHRSRRHGEIAAAAGEFLKSEAALLPATPAGGFR